VTSDVISVHDAVARYAAGAFPMDDDAAAPEIPWYVAPQRAVFELDQASRDALRRKVRRSVSACEGFTILIDEEFEAVLSLCATPPDPDDGIWITPRLRSLYRALHTEGFAHSFELWDGDGDLAAGILGVTVGRAVMLESMRRLQDHAGNALLIATLDLLAQRGATLCDIQLPTPHTTRLGCRLIDQDEYERRLQAAAYADLAGWCQVWCGFVTAGI
jgi:leucyl/phenylalanyl-tRNA--protein transferase